MTPWYIATKRYSPADAEGWASYIAWSGLTQLEEVVSLDSMLCPSVLKEIEDDDWPHIVTEHFRTQFFVDFPYLMQRVENIASKNVLCVFCDPPAPPVAPAVASFTFLGYDLVDREGDASALTNCGGFPKAFSNAELSPLGLLTDYDRAVEIQERLYDRYPEERHAGCHLWAIFRLVTS